MRNQSEDVSTSRRRGLLCNVLRIGLFATLLKLLLIPHEPSTDYEVHRHWMSLTSSLPVSEWYTDETSKWTLDYPPLFAYYTLFLSKFAPLFDRAVLLLGNHDYTSPAALLFMRLTVIFSDVFFVASVYLFLDSYSRTFAHPPSIWVLTQTAVLILLNPAIFLIDNLHFQYNTLPLSFLLLTIAALYKKKKVYATILFTITLHLKHTLLPAAPIIFVHLLCSSTVIQLVKIASTTIILTTAIWAPFLLNGLQSILPVIRRLFPFNRGLLHSYWAPNFWAFYAAVDKVFARVAPVFNVELRAVDVDPASGVVGGLKPFRVLPNVDPQACAILVLACMLPALVDTASGAYYLKQRNKWDDAGRLTRSIGVACLCAFAFGFHVHEKAVLFAIVPLSAVALGSQYGGIGKEFTVLAIVGHYALFPLVAEPEITVYKFLHFVLYEVYLIRLSNALGCFTLGYLWGWIGVELYSGVGHLHSVILGQSKLEYLPLIIITIYSAFGVLVSLSLYLKLLVALIVRNTGYQLHKKKEV